jgi:hypothetical protein
MNRCQVMLEDKAVCMIEVRRLCPERIGKGRPSLIGRDPLELSVSRQFPGHLSVC